MSSGASLELRKMAVGPSAPPIMPMAPASLGANPSARARRYAPKIPSCAAAPIRIRRGCEMSALKSVMAPMPKKISGGYQPFLTPWYRMLSTDPSSYRPILRPIPVAGSVNRGMLPMMMPKPMGTSSSGSHFFTIPSVMKMRPMTIIARCCQVQLANPVNCQNCRRLSKMVSISRWLQCLRLPGRNLPCGCGRR